MITILPRLSVKIKSFLGLDDLKFPLKQNENGLLPTMYSKEGHVRCPNCGNTSWSLSTNYIKIECNTCMSSYYNYGQIGLLQTEPHERNINNK